MNRKSNNDSSGFVLSEKTYSDDGKAAFERDRRVYKKTIDHKDEQVLRKYEKALSLIFSGELMNPRLSQLIVSEVRFWNKRDYLLVELVSDDKDASIEDELVQTEGYIRSLLASSLNKKRVPRLMFVVLAPGEYRRSHHAN